VQDVVTAGKRLSMMQQMGGFILSTGDQCGRDTPDETSSPWSRPARTYGSTEHALLARIVLTAPNAHPHSAIRLGHGSEGSLGTRNVLISHGPKVASIVRFTEGA